MNSKYYYFNCNMFHSFLSCTVEYLALHTDNTRVTQIFLSIFLSIKDIMLIIQDGVKEFIL